MMTRFRSRCALCFWLFSAIVLLAQPAANQETKKEPEAAQKGDIESLKKEENAKNHFLAGVKLLKVENYKGATAEFEEAVAIHPSANALFNLANCYKALHQYHKAIAIFSQIKSDFVDELTPDIARAVEYHEQEIFKVAARLEVRVNLAGARIEVEGETIGTSPIDTPIFYSPGYFSVEVSLEGYVAQRKKTKLVSLRTTTVEFTLRPALSKLNVHVTEPGAEVVVDGKEVGLTPLEQPLELSLGEHNIDVRKDGFETLRETVVLDANMEETIDFVMVPSGRENRPLMEEDLEKNSWIKMVSIPSWIGFGLTLATVAVDGVVWHLAVEKSDRYKEIDADYSEKYADLKSLQREEYKEKRDRAAAEAYKYNMAAIGLAIGAGVFAVTTTALVLLDIRRAHRITGNKTMTFEPTGWGMRVKF